jgi:hypothetical protein
VYDEVTDRLYIYGGGDEDYNDESLNDLWALNLNNYTWTHLADSHTKRFSTIMELTSYRHIVVHGGYTLFGNGTGEGADSMETYNIGMS